MVSDFEREKARGAAAFLAGEPFDERESVGWELGYGDAVFDTIERCDPPADHYGR